MGVIRLDSQRYYWAEETRIDQIASVMPRDRFESFLSIIHFVNNMEKEKEKGETSDCKALQQPHGRCTLFGQNVCQVKTPHPVKTVLHAHLLVHYQDCTSQRLDHLQEKASGHGRREKGHNEIEKISILRGQMPDTSRHIQEKGQAIFRGSSYC